MSKKTKVGILVSGNGSNLQAIIDEKIASCEIALVISNKPQIIFPWGRPNLVLVFQACMITNFSATEFI